MSLLTDLLSIPDVDTVMDTEVLPAMRSRGLNVDAWGTFDPWRILAYVTATLRVGARTVQAGFGAAGFGEYAFGNQTPPSGLDVTGWAPLRASSWYGVQQIQATYTQRSIKLANSTGSAYGPLRAGSIILKFTATGNRYILQDDGITIPANGSLQATFRSEFPVNSAAGLSYGDLPNATIVFVTSQFPGVTATNPSTTFSTVSQAGSGLGTLTLTGTTGDGQHNFAVKITGSGQAGSATWSVSTDGGAFVNQNNSSSASNVGGLGVNIALTNDTGGSSPSFLAGSIYFFATPGTDLVAAGRDVETPQQLGRRCYALWTMLGFPRDKATGLPLIWQPTAAAVEAILLSLSDQVAVALVQTSTTLNATVNLYVAGQGARLPSAVLAALL